MVDFGCFYGLTFDINKKYTLGFHRTGNNGTITFLFEQSEKWQDSNQSCRR